MRKPFILEDYKIHPDWKVTTMDGRNVRILCTDAKSGGRDNDIIALVESSNGAENVQRYYSNGELISDSARRGNKDLFLVTPEPELLKQKNMITYKEIHPYKSTGKPCVSVSERYYEVPPIVIRLDTIHQIVPYHNGDKEFSTIKVTEDVFDDIIVKKEEAEEIKKILLSPECNL